MRNRRKHKADACEAVAQEAWLRNRPNVLTRITARVLICVGALSKWASDVTHRESQYQTMSGEIDRLNERLIAIFREGGGQIPDGTRLVDCESRTKWNPFRRRNKELFPRPNWAPIQDLGSIDEMTEARDGSIYLFVVASQPLDDAPDTLERIRQKIATYIRAVELGIPGQVLGHKSEGRTIIIIVCNYPIHRRAMTVIKDCRKMAVARGVGLEVHNMKSLDRKLPKQN